MWVEKTRDLSCLMPCLYTYQTRNVTNRPGEGLGFSEAVHVSTQGTFILGCLNLLDSSYSYLGIWYIRDLTQSIVWVAIRQKLESVNSTGNFTLGNYDEDRGIIRQNAETVHQNLSWYTISLLGQMLEELFLWWLSSSKYQRKNVG